MGDQTVDYLRRFWNSGMPTTISGDHVFVESGAKVVTTFASGQGMSGKPVTISGDHVFVESGVWIAGLSFSGLDIQVNISGDPVLISGQPVTISGDHIYVESGARVVTTFASGQGASGAHVYLESGGFVTTQPGIQVSGTVAVSGEINLYGYDGTSGFASGIWRPIAICGSGEIIVCSGAQVITQPGIQVSGTVAMSGSISGNRVEAHIMSGVISVSGQPVTISGDHVFVESGAFVTVKSGIGVTTDPANESGLVIHVGCAGTIRTGRLVQLEGGMSGHTLSGVPTASGGISLCNVSGDFCSGKIHTIIVKNIADNDAVYVGHVNCKPYSGVGFLLAATEAINLDICSICDVWVWAQVSGQYVTWIGTDY